MLSVKHSLLDLRSIMIFSISLAALIISVSAASAHGGRERESDGAYSPKDGHHHTEDGKHDSTFDHEAILGSSKDAADSKQLSPEESVAKLLLLSKKMDRNKDGYVDKTEMRQWILRSLKMLSEEESDTRFKDQDTNQDSHVEWEEYMKEEFGKSEKEFADSDDKLDEDTLDELALIQEDKILFNAADKDKDGKLDKSEYFLFSHPEDNIDEMREAVLFSTKKIKDTNNDGQIDFQEFTGERAKDQDKEWLNEEKDRFDKELDKDGDGYLNDQEMIEWIIPDSDQIASNEVEHLFGSSDDDHDDKISPEEFKTHYNNFIGSDATNYGEHLHNIERFTDEL